MKDAAGRGAGSAPARTGDELRTLARELAEGLSERGLTLLEVERVAAMMVDRFRLGPFRDSGTEAARAPVRGGRP